MRFVLNLLWLVLSGFWMFLAYMVLGALWCITIIGIPLGLANFKLIPVSLFPLGKEIVPIESLGASRADNAVIGPQV